jgi:MYXO-CTERM domain-containing protein
MNRLIARVASAVLLFGLAAQAAQAADALNGKSLYLNGPVSGGATCASCHGPTPANNVNGILAAANQPSVISNAFAANLGGMGSLFNGKFSAAELADLAAFIGNPNVTAAPAASLAPTTLTFSGANIGQASAPLSATLTNSGNAALNIGTISIGGAAAGDFALGGGSCANGASIAAGANCTVQATFTPTAAGARAATLIITHNATGGSSTVSLNGTGNATPQATIGLSASSVDFGKLLTGTPSAVSSITVNNSGQAALNFSAISVSGASASIITRAGTCAVGTSVAAGSSCTVTVQAAPTSAGAIAASLTLASNASNGGGTVAVSLTGTAAAPAPALSATPSAVAFGSQTIGAAAATQTITLANTGNVALSIGSVGVTGSTAVKLSGSTCGTTLAVGASCATTVSFTPTTEGAVTAALAVASNAPALQVGITGTGTTQATAKPALSETGPIAFADTQVGSSAADHTTTLGNSGNAALKIATLTLGGTNPGDFVVGGTCAANVSVSSGATCTITTAFKPTAAGARSADLLLVTDSGAQFHLTLNGNGVAVVVTTPSLGISPQSFDFGSVVIGGTAPTRRFTLTNSGAAAVTLSGATFSGPFAAVADSTGCTAFPVTLQPGASCDLVVSYTPTNAGASNGGVAIQSGSTTWNIALSGQGAASTPNAAPSNHGGGGCSASQDVTDPTLAALLVLSLVVIGWRRRSRNGGAK